MNNRISPSPVLPADRKSELPVSATDLLEPLDLLSVSPGNLARWRTLRVGARSVPSFVMIGPRSGCVPVRLALLGGVRAADVVSSTAIAKMLVELNLAARLAQDYAVFGYPIANPVRADDHTADFETEFWSGSGDPVVHFFERELTTNRLDGVIAVYGDEPISGVHFQTSSRVIATEVLWPAVEIVQRFAPLSAEPVLLFDDSAECSKAFHCLEALRPRPFCLAIHTPQRSSPGEQIAAISFSLKFILNRYRKLLGEADSL
jgi:hypothetical protein